MSLWTPGGEHPVDRPTGGGAAPGSGPPPGPAPDPGPERPLTDDEAAQVEAMQAELAEARARLLEAPASVVVANHAMGLYELAAIHLTAPEPRLPEAVLAIDALAALVEGLPGRLGEAEPTLREALGQLRAAYVQVRSGGADDEAGGTDPGASGPPG
jgi:hypothetical protein